jgi:hypothetical protein
MNNIGIWGAKR